MFKYIAIRLAVSVPVLLGISLVIFSLLRLIPGDPAQSILLATLNPADDTSEYLQKANLDALRERLGLNQPFPLQYLAWLGSILTGNLGSSFRDHTPIIEELGQRIPATLELTAGALVVMLVIAIPLGITGAVYHTRLPDRLSRFVVLLGDSIPAFFLGLLLIYFFSVKLGWLPTLGRGDLAHLILPAVTLGVGLATTTARLLRTSLLDVFAQPYLLTAEAKGLPRRTIIFRHALRNALLPVLTSFSLVLGGLLGGAAVVETVFSWPGVGRYVVDAISGRDYPVIQAFALLMAVVFVVLNLVVDILYRLVNPRVRIEGVSA